MFQISKYLEIKPNSNNLVARQINPSFSVFYDHWFVLPPLTFLHKQKNNNNKSIQHSDHPKTQHD